MIQENRSNQWTKKYRLLIIVLLVVVFFIIALLIWSQWPLLFQSAPKDLNKGGQLGLLKREDAEDKSIYMVAGKITDKKNSQLTLATFEFEENPLLKNKEFIITIASDSGVWIMNNSSFYISKTNGQVVLVVNKFPDGREGAQKASLDKIMIGDSIIAFSPSDIREKDSFVAKEIYKYSK